MAAELAGELIKGFGPKDIVCFTDGACSPNPGPSGAAAYVKFPSAEAKRSATLGSRTNNIGKLYAIGMAMDLVMEAKAQGRVIPAQASIHVLTDSKFAKGMLALGHTVNKNPELVALMKDKLAQVCEQHTVFIHWIAGHSKIAGNELADQLANEGVKNSKAGISIVDPLAQPMQESKSTPASVSTSSSSGSAAAAATPPRVRKQCIQDNVPQSPDFVYDDVTAILRRKTLHNQLWYEICRPSHEPTWARMRDLVPKWKKLVKHFDDHGAEAAPPAETKAPATTEVSYTATEEKVPGAAMSESKEAPKPLKQDQLPTKASTNTSSTTSSSSTTTTSSSTPQAALDQKEESVEGELPPYPKLTSTPKITWGTKDAPEIIKQVNKAYEAITKWRKNVFKLPSGNAGKQYTIDKTELYDAYGGRSPKECIALKAAKIMAPLLLQQPADKPNYTANKGHLMRRLQLLRDGDINKLVDEGRMIQVSWRSRPKP